MPYCHQAHMCNVLMSYVDSRMHLWQHTLLCLTSMCVIQVFVHNWMSFSIERIAAHTQPRAHTTIRMLNWSGNGNVLLLDLLLLFIRWRFTCIYIFEMHVTVCIRLVRSQVSSLCRSLATLLILLARHSHSPLYCCCKSTGMHSMENKEYINIYVFGRIKCELMPWAMSGTMTVNLKFYYTFINITLAIIPLRQVWAWRSLIPVSSGSSVCDVCAWSCIFHPVLAFCLISPQILPHFVIHIQISDCCGNDLWFRMLNAPCERVAKLMWSNYNFNWFFTNLFHSKIIRAHSDACVLLHSILNRCRWNNCSFLTHAKLHIGANVRTRRQIRPTLNFDFN